MELLNLTQSFADLYRRENFLGAGSVGRVYKTDNNTVEKIIPLAKFYPDHLSVDMERKKLPFRYIGNRRFNISNTTAILLRDEECSLLRRALHEYAILQQAFNCEGVVKSYGFQLCLSDKGEFYAAHLLDYVKGNNLQYMLKEKQLPPSTTAKSLVDIASALQQLHQTGIVHRDVKPGNVIFNPKDGGNAVLIDFDIAANLSDIDPNEYMAADLGMLLSEQPIDLKGTILGSLGYFSPEQVRQEEITPSIDMYALALLGYTCLTGKNLFNIDINNQKQYFQFLGKYDNNKRDTVIIDSLRQGFREQYSQNLPDDLVDAFKIALDEDPEKRDLRPLRTSAADFSIITAEFENLSKDELDKLHQTKDQANIKTAKLNLD